MYPRNTPSACSIGKCMRCHRRHIHTVESTPSSSPRLSLLLLLLFLLLLEGVPLLEGLWKLECKHIVYPRRLGDALVSPVAGPARPRHHPLSLSLRKELSLQHFQTIETQA